jgi:hypothetical protein
MLVIVNQEAHKNGEIWLCQSDSQIREQMFVLLYLLRQDLGLAPVLASCLQGDSDLELIAMPLYACKVPSVMFYPYITYFAGTWFSLMPSFVIPNVPLDRWKGRCWLDNLSPSPYHLVAKGAENSYLAWADSKGIPYDEGKLEFLEVARLASAARTYFLDEIRYVYDESKCAFDSRKTNKPSRYCFTQAVTEFDITKEYLSWYIGQFNGLFSRVLEIGEQDDAEKRKQCLVAGLTISRLAVDALSILSTDVPIVRKWQFFGFLDALAALINLVSTGETNPREDKRKAKEILGQSFYEDSLNPSLGKIPIEVMRGEITRHTRSIYEATAQMELPTKNNQDSPEVSSQDLLWAYRNTRHGYALRREDQQALLLHSGRIPDDLPDLTIALWHYILLEFPFK